MLIYKQKGKDCKLSTDVWGFHSVNIDLKWALKSN